MKGFFLKYGALILVLVLLVLANVLVQLFVVRWDMTDDKLYSLSDDSKALLRQTDGPIEVTLFLDGELSAGFKQLQKTAEETLAEMNAYADIRVDYLNLNTADEETQMEYARQGIVPYAQSETTHGGKTVITNTFPYAEIRYQEHRIIVPLFTRTAFHDEEADLQTAIEQMEFTLAEGTHRLMHPDVNNIAILEGHGQQGNTYTDDLETTLSKYFRVYRGQIDDPQDTTDVNVHILDGFKVVIIANPQTAFTERELFIIDQYIMRGGAVLWAVNGVLLNHEMLNYYGASPTLGNQLGIEGLLFCYGVNIKQEIIQDTQCQSIALNVSNDPNAPNLQSFPWSYAPLLLPDSTNPITRDIKASVSCEMASPLAIVGRGDGIQKKALLHTSSNTRHTKPMNEVRFEDGIYPNEAEYLYPSDTIAYSLEGAFRSYFAYRMVPKGIKTDEAIRKQSVGARQVVIGNGAVVTNSWESAPMGYSRTENILYGNRDFVINAVLWLAGMDDLIPLRAKAVTLHLLNEQRAYGERDKVERISTITPIVILALIGGTVLVIRRRKYARRK